MGTENKSVNMTKVLLLIICSAALLGLSYCDDQSSETRLEEGFLYRSLREADPEGKRNRKVKKNGRKTKRKNKKEKKLKKSNEKRGGKNGNKKGKKLQVKKSKTNKKKERKRTEKKKQKTGMQNKNR